jgi:biopolymer transport protein TolQ
MEHFSFWGMLASATFVVKLVLVLLAGMSLTSWYIIFYKSIQLNRVRRRSARDLERFAKAPDLPGALRMLKTGPSSPLFPVANLALGEIKILEQADIKPEVKSSISGDNVRRVLKQGVSRELDRISRALPFLATCANAAPFIGLFGTVWGIMHAFHTIGQQKTAALAAVAPGISEALVATAIGLAVAIPASVAYNSFLGMLGSIEKEFVNFAGAFLNRAQREIPWMDLKSRQE